MTTVPKDSLLANLERVVQDTLTYFEGPGRVNAARAWTSGTPGMS